MVAGNPIQFAADNVQLIRQHWSGVRDGDVESINEARIATRRARSALTIVDGKGTERLELCRVLGRMLGAVREVDITREIFHSLSTRLPSASCAIGMVSRRVEDERQQARRKLVKQLDDLELKPLIALLGRSAFSPLKFWRDWRHSVIAETHARQQALQDAVERAPRLYMPNRLHRVRIATKKLRYTLEVADATGIRVDAAVMRDLRKAQDLLGRVHDIDVARRVVQRLDGTAKPIASEVAILDAVMGADCAAFHDKYLDRRERLLAASDYCAHLAAAERGRRSITLARRALPAAGLVALPVAMWRLTAGREGSHA